MNAILVKQLKQMNLVHNDTVLIHSSLSQIKVDADSIIRTLKAYFYDGLILMPAHTWKQIHKDNPIFDKNKEPSTVGLLPELFRLSSGVYRNTHPTHSMSGFGNDAKAYLSDGLDDITPCPISGAWGRLIERGATILHIGCDLSRSTFIHALEEKYNVPDRLAKAYEYYTIVDGDKHYKRPFIRHYSSITPGISKHYIKIEDELIKHNILKIGTFGSASVKYYKAKELDQYLGQILTLNPHYFDTP